MRRATRHRAMRVGTREPGEGGGGADNNPRAFGATAKSERRGRGQNSTHSARLNLEEAAPVGPPPASPPHHVELAQPPALQVEISPGLFVVGVVAVVSLLAVGVVVVALAFRGGADTQAQMTLPCG